MEGKPTRFLELEEKFQELESHLLEGPEKRSAPEIRQPDELAVCVRKFEIRRGHSDWERDMTLLVTSSPALNVLMQGGLLPQTTDVVTWIFLAFEFGGMAVVSAIGLLMLRRAWRRAQPPIASLTSTTRPTVLDA
jgi:hypothetical protein